MIELRSVVAGWFALAGGMMLVYLWRPWCWRCLVARIGRPLFAGVLGLMAPAIVMALIVVRVRRAFARLRPPPPARSVLLFHLQEEIDRMKGAENGNKDVRGDRVALLRAAQRALLRLPRDAPAKDVAEAFADACAQEDNRTSVQPYNRTRRE